MSTVAKSDGGQITISGGATGSEIIDDMFRYLSDNRHEVTSKGTGSASNESKFPKAFTKVITVKAAEQSKDSAKQ